MDRLNLPEYSFKIRVSNNTTELFDSLRKKYVALTPEEWVRQNFINYLIKEKKYPGGLIAIERAIDVNKMKVRPDAVVYNHTGNPLLIIEFKAPQVKVTQDTFDQIAKYNLNLKVRYLIVTNGLTHYCFKLMYENHTYEFLREIPDYNKL